jgi:hypothetical protein
MLNWQEENGKLLGFGDGFLFCRIYPEAGGWTYYNLIDEVAITGYENAECAKIPAEAEYANYIWQDEGEDDEPLSPEEIEEILGDMLYEERRDARLCK